MTGKKWAILVGVDVYEDGTREHKSKNDTEGHPITYTTLHGAVSDIMRVERYLINNMDVVECRTKILITPSWDAESPHENNRSRPVELPTYENIVKAFNWVLREAEEGDLVYFHYSGHGAQATTVFPTLKGEQGLDEALVPTDANHGGKYLRDVEIALHLKKLVSKGLIVTVVLDSCHSGSATRGSCPVRFRGITQTYKSTNDDKLSLETLKDLEKHGIGKATDVVHKGSIVSDHWLVQPQGYTLFAACLPRQSAREYEDNDGNYHGALTYWLLDTLEKTPKISTRDLWKRVSTKIQEEFPDQTPVIGGTTDRAFFGNDVLPIVHHVQVDRYEEGSMVHLKAGTLHGVRKGSEYNVFASADNGTLGALLAKVQVQEVSCLTSKATLTELKQPGRINPGCKAVLLSVPIQDQSRFCLSPHIKPELAERIQEAWKKQKNWIQLVPQHEAGQVTFRIDINPEGALEIQDRNGIKLPNLTPPLPILPCSDGRSPERLVRRLRHLAQYDAVKTIKNPNQSSTMHGAFKFELLGKDRKRNRDTSDSNITIVEEENSEFQAVDDDTLILQVKNLSKNEIFFALFDVRPLYGVDQIYPYGGSTEPLDGGSEIRLPLNMMFPRNLDAKSCVETFKIFVMPRQADLGVLHLPDLPDIDDGLRGSSSSPMESLLAKLMAPNRNGRILGIEDWATKEIVIRTFKDKSQ